MARNISKEGLEQKIEKVEKAISRNREHKTKPELWAQIKYLEEKLQFTERFLEEKGLLAEAAEYIENAIQRLEELPFD